MSKNSGGLGLLERPLARSDGVFTALPLMGLD